MEIKPGQIWKFKDKTKAFRDRDAIQIRNKIYAPDYPEYKETYWRFYLVKESRNKGRVPSQYTYDISEKNLLENYILEND